MCSGLCDTPPINGHRLKKMRNAALAAWTHDLCINLKTQYCGLHCFGYQHNSADFSGSCSGWW